MPKLVSALAAFWNHIDPKVRAPFAAAVVSAIAQWASTGTFDAAEIATTATALVMAVVGYTVPNRASGLPDRSVQDEPADVPDA